MQWTLEVQTAGNNIVLQISSFSCVALQIEPVIALAVVSRVCS